MVLMATFFDPHLPWNNLFLPRLYFCLSDEETRTLDYTCELYPSWSLRTVEGGGPHLLILEPATPERLSCPSQLPSSVLAALICCESAGCVDLVPSLPAETVCHAKKNVINLCFSLLSGCFCILGSSPDRSITATCTLLENHTQFGKSIKTGR